MRANQLRLWFASFAYVLLEALRRIGLRHTQFQDATCGTIRLKLLKLGAKVTVSVRRIKVAIASACPYRTEFALAHLRLCAGPARRAPAPERLVARGPSASRRCPGAPRRARKPPQTSSPLVWRRFAPAVRALIRLLRLRDPPGALSIARSPPGLSSR
jgi:Transposase DDE domain group 1